MVTAAIEAELPHEPPLLFEEHAAKGAHMGTRLGPAPKLINAARKQQ